MKLIILFIFLSSVKCRASCPPPPGESPPPGCSLTFIQDQGGEIDCQEDEDCPYSLDWWNSDGRKDQVCGTVGFEYYKCENERCKSQPGPCPVPESSEGLLIRVTPVGGITEDDQSQCRFCPKAPDQLECPPERPCRSTTGYCEQPLCNRRRCWCDINEETSLTEIKLGGILTVGGYGTSGRLSTAEIFNPRSGRSCKIGDIPASTSSLSLCGNLACGGYSGQDKSCSLFDGAGTFTALTVTLREQRVRHLCWQLQSGSVLLLGGLYSGWTSERLAADGSSSTADFNLPYSIHDACGIELNGNFIVTGGGSSKKTVAEFTETGQVTYLADLQEGRSHHGCSKFVDNNGQTALLVTGGVDGSNILSSTEIYLNSQWSSAASLPTPRYGLRGSTVQNSVYVFGGWDGSNYYDTILRYNPSTDTWTEAGQLTEPKEYPASTRVADISEFNTICS